MMQLAARDSAVAFGIIAEAHVAPPGTPATAWHNRFEPARADELLQLAVERLKSETVDFVALLGDLTHFGDADSLRRVASITAEIRSNLLVLPGNHDLDEQPRALARFSGNFDGSTSVTAPLRLQPQPGIEVDLLAIERDVGNNRLYSVGFGDLSPDAGGGLHIVFSHFPLLPLERRLSEAGLKHPGDLADRRVLEEIVMSNEGPVVVVHGHLHVRATTVAGPVLHLSCAALVEPPHEITILSIGGDDSGRMSIERRAIEVREVDEKISLPVLSPKQERYTWDGAWKIAGF